MSVCWFFCGELIEVNGIVVEVYNVKNVVVVYYIVGFSCGVCIQNVWVFGIGIVWFSIGIYVEVFYFFLDFFFVYEDVVDFGGEIV